MKKNELIQTVKTELGKVGHGIAFDVIAEGVRQEDSWWYIPILATRNGKDMPREAMVSILANTEDELEQNQHLNVLFIPAVPTERPDKVRAGSRPSR